jgi:nickel-dependent lactate racemase
MRVNLAYGKTGLILDFPEAWNIQVVEPAYPPALPEPLRQLAVALEHPIEACALREMVKPNSTVGIILNDMTRATPNALILDGLLEQLSFLPNQNIRLFIALGTHRVMSDSELIEQLGLENFQHFTIIQNNAFDPDTQTYLGRTSQSHEIWINRDLMNCDVKILTGFIEPHFFAGYSGGGKAIMPGMSGLETILGNHCAANIAHPKATFGATRGNPVWEEIQEVAFAAKATFLLNVTLNRGQEITGIFAGDLESAHAAGVEFVRRSAMVAVDGLYDIFVTGNSGHPLDLNLYQAVKGISAASQIVRPGGMICMAASCWDGIPDHGHFKQLLADAECPERILKTIMNPGFRMQDQWQAQILAQVLQKARVYLYSDHLSDEDIYNALLTPTHDIPGTILQELQKLPHPARICVLPEGPQTIPYSA